MKIDILKWKEFKIHEIFDVSIARSQDFGSLEKGNITFVGRISSNNGVQGYVDSDTTTLGNCITIGMVGSYNPFYQKNNFVASQNILVLRNSKCTEKAAIFICTVLKQILKSKYNYNRPIQKNKFETETIRLPSLDNAPDWEYMKKYISFLRSKPLKTRKAVMLTLSSPTEWGEYELKDLFKFYKGKRLTKSDMIYGNVNFIGAISENNGVRQSIDVEPMFSPNCITVNYNGSVGEAFYQHEPFWASDDVNVLYADGWELNKYRAMFIITIIKSNRYKFSYGRKWTLEKMKESIIKLPKAIDNSPDWAYMENYIKSLPYSDRI